MLNRVGRHKRGVTLWQIGLLPRVAKRRLDRVEVPPDGLEHNFLRRRVCWLENSISKAPRLTVDQSRGRGVKPSEQFIPAPRHSSCPKDPRNWLRAITNRHDTSSGCWWKLRAVISPKLSSAISRSSLPCACQNIALSSTLLLISPPPSSTRSTLYPSNLFPLLPLIESVTGVTYQRSNLSPLRAASCGAQGRP
jgi:hypothetical protein